MEADGHERLEFRGETGVRDVHLEPLAHRWHLKLYNWMKSPGKLFRREMGKILALSYSEIKKIRGTG